MLSRQELDELAGLGISPDKVEKVLHRLDVVRIVDTKVDGWRFKGAAFHNDQTDRMEATHVASDGASVIDKLRAGFDLDHGAQDHQVMQELGPGLYVSDRPQVWMGRATHKWDFIKTLTREQRAGYLATLRNAVQTLKEAHYVSEREVESAHNRINDAVFNPALVDSAAVFLANQPYNIASWSPEFLAPLGIVNNGQPKEFPVEFVGRFAEMKYDRFYHRATHGILRGLGLDGAFVPGGWSGIPQTVIWTNRSVLRFGEWRR